MENINDTAAFMQKYQLLLQQGEILPLPVLGHSMAPFLVHQRDTVWLSASGGPYKVGDIVLYRRISGSYILHRICKKDGNQYTMIGDAHTIKESHIREEQILAVVVRVRRNNVMEQPGKFWWDFFARIWIRLIPLRPMLLRSYTIFIKLFRRSL